MSLVHQSLDAKVQEGVLRDSFLYWQCRVRQISMRDNMGRPDDSIAPALTLAGEMEPMCRVITLLSKVSQYSKMPEIQHIIKSTNDPEERRRKAVEFFSETYFQNTREFSDTLTAIFPPNSPGAKEICRAGTCTLSFAGYGQQFDIFCKVWALSSEDPGFQVSWCHNLLFNSRLHPEVEILCFEPNWGSSSGKPIT